MLNLAVEVGDTIDGRYRVERVLGQGGMGVVVAARHLRLGTLAAIKFPLAHLALRTDVVERLLREARIAMQLRSEHVARVYDLGVHDRGGPYLVMELLVGRDLSQKLEQDGPLQSEVAIECTLQACEALAEAHATGVIHRDLKPSNLFLSTRPDGSPLLKVIDFGLAKSLDPEQLTTLTSSGALLGSLPFMAPEQMRGSGAVDARSDVYALGATLYALLTGRPPFAGKSVLDVYDRIVAGAPPMPTERSVAPALEHAVHRCLHVSPEQRFESIGAFAEALMPLASPHAKIHAIRARATLISPLEATREPYLSGHSSDALLSTTLVTNATAIQGKVSWRFAQIVLVGLAFGLTVFGLLSLGARGARDSTGVGSRGVLSAPQLIVEPVAVLPSATRVVSAQESVPEAVQSGEPDSRRPARDGSSVRREPVRSLQRKALVSPTRTEVVPDPLADPN